MAKTELSVSLSRDGIWSVNERGPSRVAVLEPDGGVHLARDYEQGPDSHHVETP